MVVQDSAGKIVDQLYDLCRYCGELSLATDITPTSLTDPDGQSIEDLMSLRSKKENDLLNHKVIGLNISLWQPPDDQQKL